MNVTIFWARHFFERSAPAIGGLVINFAIAQSIITSDHRGWGVLFAVVLGSLLNAALMHRQKNVIDLFVDSADEGINRALKNINLAAFSLLGGIPMAAAAMNNIAGDGLVLGTLSAMLAAALILSWGSVFANMTDTRSCE